MNQFRLHQRIGNFKTSGIAHLTAHKLVFNKRGGDESGKCTVVPNKDNLVWGVVVEINFEQKEKLDYFEGVGHGYDAVIKNIQITGKTIEAVLYQAQLEAMDDGLSPFDWYKDFVLSGAKRHQLPADYIQTIEQIAAIADHDRLRAKLNRKILNGEYPPKLP